MKKKIIISISAIMLLAFTIAAFAYTKTSNYNTTTSCCKMADCCKDGICKMNHECCKDKDSCPMKSGETKDCPMHQKTEVNR